MAPSIFNSTGIYTLALLMHLTHSSPMLNYPAMNMSTNTSSMVNQTTNSTFFSTPLSSDYLSTEFMTTFGEATVGISKALIYIGGAIFIVIAVLLIAYCVYACRRRQKRIKESKTPVNHMDDMDDDTKKIKAYEVHVTQNAFAAHNAKNAYATNPLNRVRTTSASTGVELHKMNSTSTNTVQTCSSIAETAAINAMNKQIILNNPTSKATPFVPMQIQTMSDNQASQAKNLKSMQFVTGTPIGQGDVRNRTGTVEYTAQPTEEKVQARLEPLDTPVPLTERSESNVSISQETNITTVTNQTAIYKENGNEQDSDRNTDSSVDSGSESEPEPFDTKPIEVVDTLTAMIQKSQNTSAVNGSFPNHNNFQNESEMDEESEESEEESDSYDMFTPLPAQNEAEIKQIQPQ